MNVTTADQGFIYDPFSPEIFDDPYPKYRILRDEHPLYYNAERNFWTLSRFDDCQEGARNWQGLSSGSGVELDDTQTFYPETFGPGNIVITDPPDHRRIRRAVQQHFTPQAVQVLDPSVRAIVNRLLDRLEDGSEADLAEDFAWRIPVATVSKMLGFPEEEQDPLADLLFDFETREPEADQGDYFEVPAVAREAGGRLADFISEQLAARRAAPGDDLLSALLRAEDEGDLAPEESRGLTFILVMAGVDTTACLVSNGLHRLSDRPDDRRRIAEDPEFATSATEELVRWEAPVQGEARVALEDIEIAGGTIPKGARVWLCYGAANRDERRFEDPERLDFARPPKRHLGFGEGIHHCIGAPLARLEGRIAFEEFFRRFDSYQIGSNAKRHHQHTTRGWTRLPAELDKG